MLVIMLIVWVKTHDDDDDDDDDDRINLDQYILMGHLQIAP